MTTDLLAGRRILVTGGARGLGAEIAANCVDAGARVVIVDVRDDEGRAVVDGLGNAARYLHLDVTDEGAWSSVLADVISVEGGLDGLVNNAAVLHMGSIEHTDVRTARTLLDVNVLGVFLGIRAVAPLMRQAGGGSIVNVSSIDGLGGMNSVAMYSATKWAVRGLTRSAALELGRDGIRVNAVCPSMGNPQMSEPFTDRVDVDRYLRTMPQPKLYRNGRPVSVTSRDVARTVRFLLSEDAATCTGGDYPVDAGWTAGPYCEGLPDF
jgi:3alpha(or 20beta)-hydroxysteroid dehydrogenase